MIIIFKFVSIKYKNQRAKVENMLELADKHFRDSSTTLLNILDKYINLLAKFTQLVEYLQVLNDWGPLLGIQC